MDNFVNPAMQGLQAYQVGQQINAQRMQQQQQAQLMQRREQMKSDLAQFAQREGKTAEDYMRFSEMYPEMAEQMKASIKQLDATQKQEKINQLMPIYAALSSGNTDAAKEQISRLQQAYKTSGMQQDAQNLEMLNQNIDIDPRAALVSSGLFLSQAMGGEEAKKFFEAQKTFGEERRSEQLQPGQLVKQGLESGLSKQEALRTAAQTKKLDAETQKIIMEMEALKKSGGLDREKMFDKERKLAKEYQTSAGDFFKVQEAYRRIEAVEDTPAGDVALIFNYMKMLDPGSTVREGEFATAEQTAGVPDRIVNLYNRAVSGKRLGADQIKGFISQSKSLMNAAKKREKEVRSGLERVAKDYGLNAENIFVGAPSIEKETGSPPQKPPPATEKKIQRTGTLNGRKVIQYTDGTIVYAD